MSSQSTEANTKSNDIPPAPSRGRRALSTYDLATPSKVALGSRMREAREVAGLTLTQAAELMGYVAPVQMSLFESGQRVPPLGKLIEAASVYGCTMDYLCGLSSDMERDPAVAVQAQIAARLTGDIRQLVGVVQHAGLTVVRELSPRLRRLAPFARRAIEAHTALEVCRTLNPQFDATIKGGSALAVNLSRLAAEAQDHLDAFARADRAARACPSEFLQGLAVADLGIDAKARLMPRASRTGLDANNDVDVYVEEQGHQAEAATHG